jgi:quercetin dioxygenase-like cupin family protein
VVKSWRKCCRFRHIIGFSTMKKTIDRRRFLKQAGVLALALPPALRAAEAPTTVGAAGPTIVRTRELMAGDPNRSSTNGKIWKLHQSATSRTNLVEMRGEAGEHIHPDAEHSLYVISGEVTVRAGNIETTLLAGDYISIPAGMKHGYSVPANKPALLISMDAPPYDAAKTIRAKPGGK